MTLEDPDIATIETDVLVLGDVREATDLVQDLAGTIPGVRGVYGGRLRNVRQVEAFTANLISVNRRYKAHAGHSSHRHLIKLARRSSESWGNGSGGDC